MFMLVILNGDVHPHTIPWPFFRSNVIVSFLVVVASGWAWCASSRRGALAGLAPR